GELAGAGLVARFVKDDLGKAGQLGIDDLRTDGSRSIGVGLADLIAKAAIANLVLIVRGARLLDDERLGRTGRDGDGKGGGRGGDLDSLGKRLRLRSTGEKRQTEGGQRGPGKRDGTHGHRKGLSNK